jgi:hypothetical protein
MMFGNFRVLYLAGMGRSGSTLTERLLGELPGVCAAGETVHLWQRGVTDDERCGCGVAFGRCDFWSAVAGVAFGGWAKLDVARIGTLRSRVDRTRHIPLLSLPSMPRAARRDLAEYTSYYQRLYQAIAETSGCRTVVDSSKHASLAFGLSHRADIDLRVIHLVRDSRAVAYSWSTWVGRPEAAAGSYMTRYSPVRAAREWDLQNGALQLLARGRTPVLRVRYEDLVSAVAPTLRLISRFAGLTADEPALGFVGGGQQEQWAELGAAHTAAGNPMRFTTGKVAIRRDDRWQKALPDPQRRAVTALTLPLLSYYGYTPAGGETA